MNKNIFLLLETKEDGVNNLLGARSSLTHGKYTFQDNFEEMWAPNCDVYITGSKLKIVAELAGIDKNSVEVIFSDNYLVLKGSRDFGLPANDVCYYHMEIETGNFERTIYFPEVKLVAESHIVSLEKGLLKIEFLIDSDEEITIPVK
ncbi:MAG: Hsp20/alpha crystallin family protein [Candidatus Cloacimonadales bacterium]